MVRTHSARRGRATAVAVFSMSISFASGFAPGQTTQPATRPSTQPATQPATQPSTQPSTQRAARAFIGAIERAHGAEAWTGHRALEADLEVSFRGNAVYRGRILFDTPVGHVRMEREDGAVAVFDGEKAWVAPADAAFPRARFHVLTWPYFAAASFKLDDPGTRLELLGNLPLDGRPHPAAKLTFGEGVGDTPDDWYILYRDARTGRLAAMAYIVTYGTPKAEAEGEPHAITYHDFVEVDGATLSTSWRFRNWTRERGVYGEPIGSVTLKNPRFVEPADDAFTKPADAREDELPAE